jgi:glycosyltransferase involved in cell wall biosynthesis
MHPPMISVITVCYNSARTIEGTLRSVSLQTWPNIEHIVIDGGSTDGTTSILERCQERLAVMVSEPDGGIYHAMNKGLDRCNGEIIGFLNADDFYADNDVLTKVAEAFQDPRVEACFGDLVYVSEDTRRVLRYWKSRPYRRGSFARGWSPAHPTFYIRRSALGRLGPFDLTYRLAADTEFMMRYLEAHAVPSVYIPRIQVRMRMGGASNNSASNVIRQNSEIFHAFRKHGISYSVVLFWCSKLLCRLEQWAVAIFLS